MGQNTSQKHNTFIGKDENLGRTNLRSNAISVGRITLVRCAYILNLDWLTLASFRPKCAKLKWSKRFTELFLNRTLK